MEKGDILGYFERLDRALNAPATLHIYGSAAFMLLDEPGRTSLDIDVAAPYSSADLGDLRCAAATAGLPINPEDGTAGDHLEWISALRLCLPPPDSQTDLILWQGARLRIKTSSIPCLIASKLIRYDEVDRSDVQYACRQTAVTVPSVVAAVDALPAAFRRDPVVLENLENFRTDWVLWGAGER